MELPGTVIGDQAMGQWQVLLRWWPGISEAAVHRGRPTVLARPFVFPPHSVDTVATHEESAKEFNLRLRRCCAIHPKERQFNAVVTLERLSGRGGSKSEDFRQPVILSLQTRDLDTKLLNNPEFFVVHSSSDASPLWTLIDTAIGRNQAIC